MLLGCRINRDPGRRRRADLAQRRSPHPHHGIVAVEMIVATSGLGYMITQAGDYLDLSLAFAGLITIAVVSLTLDAGLRGLLLLADPSRRG
jgi:ABC-type proline/glycine betaine transport system permease subunit